MKAIAPGKLILSGEHSVVYGRPAVAMAIDRSVEAVIAPMPAGAGEDEVGFDLPDLQQKERFRVRALRELKSRVLKNYTLFLNGELGIREVLHKPIELLEFCFINLLDGLHLKMQQGLDIRLQSTLPIGCGLGSSAAAILSVLRGVGHYFRVDFRPDWYLQYSMEAENMQHGRSSGLDTYISLHGGCAVFQDGQARRIPLPRVPVSLVNTGTPQTTTGECVSTVRERFAGSPVWNDFESVTLAMERAVADNDAGAFREQVRRNHRLLTGIGVVPDPVRRFIEDVEVAGGAAKVCGAGAVRGESAGVVLVSADEDVSALAQAYGFTHLAVRGEPLGVRLV